MAKEKTGKVKKIVQDVRSGIRAGILQSLGLSKGAS